MDEVEDIKYEKVNSAIRNYGEEEILRNNQKKTVQNELVSELKNNSTSILKNSN